MKWSKLLKKLDEGKDYFDYPDPHRKALRAIAMLHRPVDKKYCGICTVDNFGERQHPYPCETIQAIESALD